MENTEDQVTKQITAQDEGQVSEKSKPKPRRASGKKAAKKDEAPSSLKRFNQVNRKVPKPQTGKEHTIVVE